MDKEKNTPNVYYKYSEYLLTRYNEKVYKLPVKLSGTCPNRDGKISFGGCAFCGEEGGSFENLCSALSVKEQIKINKERISKKYKAAKFIVYFQNYTNTYFEENTFKSMLLEAIDNDIVGIYISTRPDCVCDWQIDFLKEMKKKYSLDIVFELGLQTANYKNLFEINRGHGLAEFIDCVLRIHAGGLEVCSHVIIGLPGDCELDVVETAKVLSALKVEQVKIHALYLIKDTEYGRMYLEGSLPLISRDSYISWTISFLRHLSEDVVVQRLIGRSPEENSLFSNWSTSWWKIHEMIVLEMIDKGYKQGDLKMQPVNK